MDKKLTPVFFGHTSLNRLMEIKHNVCTSKKSCTTMFCGHFSSCIITNIESKQTKTKTNKIWRLLVSILLLVRKFSVFFSENEDTEIAERPLHREIFTFAMSLKFLIEGLWAFRSKNSVPSSKSWSLAWVTSEILLQITLCAHTSPNRNWRTGVACELPGEIADRFQAIWLVF
jgi:hypothetical protein